MHKESSHFTPVMYLQSNENSNQDQQDFANIVKQILSNVILLDLFFTDGEKEF